MSEFVTVDVKVNDKAIQQKLDSLIDSKTMLEVHNALARYCNPYVPMDEGVLSQTTQITTGYVRYYAPYAHYMYTGEVYGPNIPMKDKDGNIKGWYSPPGQPKHPTGRPIQYDKTKHPLASKEWDKAMMASNGEAFVAEVKRILVERARELYG